MSMSVSHTRLNQRFVLCSFNLLDWKRYDMSTFFSFEKATATVPKMQTMQLCFIALWSLSLSSTSAFVMNEASFSFMHHRSKELSRKHNGNETKRATVFALDLSRNKNYYEDYINYSAEDNDSYNDHETIDIYELAHRSTNHAGKFRLRRCCSYR